MEEKYTNNEEITEEMLDEEVDYTEDLSLEDIQNELMGGSTAADPMTQLKLQLAQVNDQFLRLAAEYENFRRRSIKEKDAVKATAISGAVNAFLPVYDNLERALKHETADADFRKGIEMTFTILTEALAKIGVTVIPAEVGTAFDPNMHEAMMHIEDENLGENVIAEVFTSGFISNDVVIRHAMVKVAN